MLTRDQIAAYRRDGYVKLEGTLTAEQYRRIRSAVRALDVRRHRQTAVRRVR